MATEVAVLTARLEADTRQFRKDIGQAESKMSKFGSVAKAGAIGAGVAVAYGLGKVAKIGWDEFNQGQKVAAQTNAVLKSTGGIANVTAKEVDALGVSIMKKSGIDDEVIKSGENILLTFKGIRNEVGLGNDIFNQATQLTTDMSVAMGKDLNSSAVMVGKALNDPAKGLTALTRVGVTFTDQQEKQIKSFVKNGETMKAQKIILSELTSEFGGSAEAAGKTLGGQINILRERFNNWAGDMVEKAIPMAERFSAWFQKEILPAIKDLGESIRKAWPDIRKFLQALGEGAQRLAPLWRLAIRLIGIVIRVYAKFLSVYVQGIVKIIEKGAQFVSWLRGPLGAAFEFVRDKLALVRDTALFTFDFFRDKGQLVIDKVRAVVQALRDMVSFIRSIPGQIRDALGGIGGFFAGLAGKISGAVGDGVIDTSMIARATNPGGLVPSILDELGAAQAMGLTLTSGFRPGAVTSTGNPSLHSVGKAIDVAGPASKMAAFFRAMVGRPGIRELLYSPIGGWYGGGGIVPLSGSVLRDHFSHVHVGVFDDAMRKQRFLQPGWTLAGNFTGRPEPVGAAAMGGGTVVIQNYGVLGSEREVLNWFDRALERRQRRGGR